MKPDGGPAFPSTSTYQSGTYQVPNYQATYGGLAGATPPMTTVPVYSTSTQIGMSLREWLAGQALTGYMLWEGSGAHAQFAPHEIAKRCFAIADAMLEERNRE